MNQPNVNRTARRIFRPLLTATEPARLDLLGVNRAKAMEAIRAVGDLVRCTDEDDPLEARYVFTAGSSAFFEPRSWIEGAWDRLRLWWRRSAWWRMAC